MNRRTILAALAALPFVRQSAVQAQDGPRLHPPPNPSASCAPPFVRTREPVDYSEQFQSDLIVWGWNNRHLTSAYIAVSPEMQGMTPPIKGIAWIDGQPAGMFDLAGISFRIIATAPGMLPPDVLYAITADCGTLL